MPEWLLTLIQTSRRVARERRLDYDAADVWTKRELHNWLRQGSIDDEDR